MPLVMRTKLFGPQLRVEFEADGTAILRMGCPSIPEAAKM
jgi:hypothetical protein